MASLLSVCNIHILLERIVYTAPISSSTEDVWKHKTWKHYQRRKKKQNTSFSLLISDSKRASTSSLESRSRCLWRHVFCHMSCRTYHSLSWWLVFVDSRKAELPVLIWKTRKHIVLSMKNIIKIWSDLNNKMILTTKTIFVDLNNKASINCH